MAEVIAVRVSDPRWPDTFADVCLQPQQFSSWNRTDPNSAKMLAVGLDDPAFALCLRIAQEAIEGRRWGYSKGANHFMTSELYARLEDGHWGLYMPVVARIGRHVFLMG